MPWPRSGCELTRVKIRSLYSGNRDWDWRPPLRHGMFPLAGARYRPLGAD
jgi:hypothetical protein